MVQHQRRPRSLLPPLRTLQARKAQQPGAQERRTELIKRNLSSAFKSTLTSPQGQSQSRSRRGKTKRGGAVALAAQRGETPTGLFASETHHSTSASTPSSSHGQQPYFIPSGGASASAAEPVPFYKHNMRKVFNKDQMQ